MKTHKNNKTPDQGLLAQPDEQAVSDNNHRKEFRIEFGIEQYRYAFVRIQAKSLAEAKQIAAGFDQEDITGWGAMNSGMKVMCVELVEEGNSHE